MIRQIWEWLWGTDHYRI